MAVRNAGTLLGVPRLLRAAQLGSRPSLIDLINLVVNCAGARSAGNPLVTCDVAGAGNQLTVWLVRHSQRKRGATDRPDLRSNGASPRPTGRSQLEVICSSFAPEPKELQPFAVTQIYSPSTCCATV
jgi:hypothetical protein